MSIFTPDFDKENFSQIINLEYHLQQNRNRKKPLDLNYIRRFGLVGVISNDITMNVTCDRVNNWMCGDDIVYNMCMTAFYGLVLTFDEEPQTLLTFDTKGNSGMVIKQNKGIRPAQYYPDRTYHYLSDSKGLRHIKSNVELMYQIALDLAEETQMCILEVQSAKNRPDFKLSKDEKLLWKLLETFDIAPFNLGFSENRKGDWYKHIN